MFIWIAACEQPVRPYEHFKAMIKPGMERSEAVKLLQASAWYYQMCPRKSIEPKSNFVADLFFFGSHQYDKAEIVIVISYPENDKLIVDQIGTFEPYAWHTGYADCIQRDRFDG